MESMMKTTPTVFAVGENYQIMMPFAEDAVAWIRIGERCFYDHSNGILRSAVRIHRVNVPGDLLNAAKAYTVCYRRVLDRKPYFPVLEEPIEVEYSFRPVPSVNVRIYQVSDAHGMIDAPVAAARKFCDVYGGIDLLILNAGVRAKRKLFEIALSAHQNADGHIFDGILILVVLLNVAVLNDQRATRLRVLLLDGLQLLDNDTAQLDLIGKRFLHIGDLLL